MRKVFLTMLITCACHLEAQVIITTIAGKGVVSGFNGDGNIAINALLNNPQNICLDKYENIYFTDASNNRIRKIDKSTGIITTIAGNGDPKYFGDGDLATAASLFIPTAIYVDSALNVYVTDVLNYRVRKINSKTGTITTIAGTGVQGNSGDNSAATNAQVNYVSGICLDRHNNVIIVDNENHNVRKIDAITGNIVTIAGNSTAGYSGDNGLAINAQFNEPGQPFVDNDSNIFITDTKNNAVRKIDSKTGIITTIAGTGTQGHSGDGGPATNANLYEPYGIFVDTQNNIFVSEYWTGTIRKINGATGIITTVAGKGTIGFSGDGGPATNAEMAAAGICMDHHGAIFIADVGNHVIRKVYDSSQHYTLVNNITKADIIIYPNPASDQLTIEGAEGSEVSVWNMVGQQMLHIDKTKATQIINISQLPSGMYVIHILSSSGSKEVRRFVKE